MLPGSREEDVFFRQLWSTFYTCAEVANVAGVWEPGMPRQRQRDLTAAALLRADYPSLPDSLPPQASTGTWINRQMAALTPQSQLNRMAVQLLMFGDCLARSQWVTVTRLLRSERRSEAERTTVNELRPHLASCLPAGLTLQIDPDVIRTIVAEPVYHLLRDTPANLSRG